MKESSDDFEKILAHVESTIGQHDGWHQWPGDWPGDIEAALVDAVFSAWVVYRSKYRRDIYSEVTAWSHAHRRQTHSLEALLAKIDSVGVIEWTALFGNLQRSPRWPASHLTGRRQA